jgi:hypothetical protein
MCQSSARRRGWSAEGKVREPCRHSEDTARKERLDADDPRLPVHDRAVGAARLGLGMNLSFAIGQKRRFLACSARFRVAVGREAKRAGEVLLGSKYRVCQETDFFPADDLSAALAALEPDRHFKGEKGHLTVHAEHLLAGATRAKGS